MEAKTGLSKLNHSGFKFIPKRPFLKFIMEMESEKRMT